MAAKATTFTTTTTIEKVENFKAQSKISPFALLKGEEIRKYKFEASSFI